MNLAEVSVGNLVFRAKNGFLCPNSSRIDILAEALWAGTTKKNSRRLKFF